MPWTVTRQIQCDGGTHIVEISQGTLDYANADALSAKFDGEFESFDNPIEALEAALKIRDVWQAETKESIEVGHGATWGMTMPFSGSDDEALQEWAQEAYAKLALNAKSCDWCGSTLWDSQLVFGGANLPGEEFCSDNCVRMAVSANEEYDEHFREED